MRWPDIPFSPSDRTLRQFAGLWIVFFVGLACWQAFVRDNMVFGAVAGALAVSIGPVGLVRPRLIRPVFVGWMVVCFPIGWAVSRILLGIVFYGIFTPLAFLFRLCGRDALQLRPKSIASDSYWSAKSIPSDSRSYFRPF